MTLLAPVVAVLLAVAPPPPAEASPPAPAPTEAAPAPATFVLETPRFRIVHTERARGAAAYLAGLIEPLRDDVDRLLGRPYPGTTEVRLGLGPEEYQALALPGGRPPAWAVALAYPEANVVLVEAHSLIRGDGQLTLRHELVHVALGRFGRDWPRWFQEGLAQALTGERRFRLEHVATLTRAVTQDQVYRFDDLRDGFPARPEDVEIAYAQSVAFLEFLRDRHGPWALGHLLDRVQGGDGFEKAFGVAFHSPLSVEERDFREELPRRYPWWPLLVSGGTVLWVAAAGLLVVGALRRRRVVRAWRAEQLRVEALEEVAEALVEATPANEDLSWEPLPLDERPWVVTSLRVLRLPGRRRALSPARRASSPAP